MIVVSHTHWDREWYLGFQRRRVRLVQMMDALLDLLAREPRFTSFTLDGQTIPLEDYLEVRPERRAEIGERVRQGRLLVGPWYTSPDEFLVSAEALIRNLMLGHRIAAEFDGPMRVGYLPDSFGQMAQMPQILLGFGISSAVFWRGMGDEPGKSEFRWRAPDGSTVLAVHLPEGYGNAADLPIERKALVERMATLRSKLSRCATTDHLLLMNGGDHHWPQEDLPQVLDLANEALEGVDLVQGTLPMYIEAIEKANPAMPTIEGELRCAKYTYLLPGTLSSRMPLKQRNAAVQTLLERWAEPLSALASLVTNDKLANLPTCNLQPLIWQAWKYLLQNHAHDSICGCHIDPVQREMELRFNWAEEIAEEVTNRSLRAIVELIDTSASGETIPVVVFNPLGVPRTDVVTISFQPLISLEEGTFAVADCEGRTVPPEMVSGKPLEVFSAEASREEFAEFMQMVEGGEVFDLRITSLDLSPLEAGTLEVSATLVKKETAPEVDFEAIKRRIQAVLEDETWQRFSVKAYFAPEVKLSFLAEDVPGCGYKTYAIHHPTLNIQYPISSNQHPASSIENEFYAATASWTRGRRATSIGTSHLPATWWWTGRPSRQG